MVILALDQATISGFAVVKDDGTVLDSGIWHLADKKRTGESRGMRYIRFRKFLAEAIVKWKPGMICHEQTLLRGGAATEIANGLKALILEAAAEAKIEVSCVHTSELKKFATGKGNAEKREMENAANLLSGRSVIDDNEADAICIGLWASSIYGTFPAPKRAFEKKAPRRKNRRASSWIDEI